MKDSIKWTFVGVGAIVALGVGWYLVSPAFITSTADDASPLDTGIATIQDDFESMDNETREEFDSEIEKMKTFEVDMYESSPVIDDFYGPIILSSGAFVERAHEVAGTAVLIEGVESRTLRFEDFETINGPNLHIYLASDLGSDDFIDLGPIRATKGNVNYDVPVDIDIEKYNKVLVWCVPFKVLFSYAELQ
ncbi:DM13 domain-containing protein [Candidatus Uhrbacteria bacterium]|nr:DM13 domain-containing protein [Candidatus Uhrbacteria bacterium]